jgi:polar amino acid transport system permease protein
MTYTWDFDFVLTYYPLLLRGLVGTLQLAAITFVFSIIIGLVIGAARTSRNALIRFAGTTYVEIFRNVPSLIHIYIWFYILPILTGMQNDSGTTCVVAFSLYTGAFMAEVYRSGLQSIEHGQWEAAKALGFGYVQQMRYVILPQTIRRTIPAFTNRTIDLIKLTSLASLLSYREVVYQARQMAAVEFRPIESFTVLAILFSLILLPLSYASKYLESRLGRTQ